MGVSNGDEASPWPLHVGDTNHIQGHDSKVNLAIRECLNLSFQPTIEGAAVRTEMEKILNKVKGIITEVNQVKDTLKVTIKQKSKLEAETLSLLHNFQVEGKIK